MIESKRLYLRQWKESDRPIFAKLNADPQTMRFFPNTVTPKQTNLFIDKLIERINSTGMGFFAVEIKETSEFIGFTGLSNPNYETPFTPCTEIGWRLHRNFWGKGFATEAGKAVLHYAFNDLKKNEIVSFTSKLNIPSIKVMERIGMTRDLEGDFDHPMVEAGHKLKPHILYRLYAQDFLI